MPRYVKRPWFHPLGVMANAPHVYITQVMTLFLIAVYPFRNYFGDIWDRSRFTHDISLRQRAICYYGEIEMAFRRQAYAASPLLWGDQRVGQDAALLVKQQAQRGTMTNEEVYFHAHQRDAMRAQKLLQEIQDIKAQIAATGAK